MCEGVCVQTHICLSKGQNLLCKSRLKAKPKPSRPWGRGCDGCGVTTSMGSALQPDFPHLSPFLPCVSQSELPLQGTDWAPWRSRGCYCIESKAGPKAPSSSISGVSSLLHCLTVHSTSSGISCLPLHSARHTVLCS